MINFEYIYYTCRFIDEADRMMDQISQDWIAQVEKCAYKDSRRQTPEPITVASCSKIQMPVSNDL